MSNSCPVVPKFLGRSLFCLYLQGFMYEVRIFLEQEKSVPASYVKPKSGNLFWFTTSRSAPPIQAQGNEQDKHQDADLQQLPG